MLSGTVWTRKNQEKMDGHHQYKAVSTPSVNLTCVTQCIKELKAEPDLFRGRRKQSNHHQLPKKPPNGCLKRLSSGEGRYAR